MRCEERIPTVSVVLIYRFLQEMMATLTTRPIRTVNERLGLASAEAIELCQNLGLAAVLDSVAGGAVLAEP